MLEFLFIDLRRPVYAFMVNLRSLIRLLRAVYALPSSINVIHLKKLACQSFLKEMTGGADRDRTGDLMNAIHALYQLSYSPTPKE